MPQFSTKQFLPLIPREKLTEGCLIPVEHGKLKFLIIQNHGENHILKNACGHFGVPLDTGEVVDNTLVCPQHLISFDLETGQVVNRPWENCNPIQVYESAIEEGYVGVYVDLAEEL